MALGLYNWAMIEAVSNITKTNSQGQSTSKNVCFCFCEGAPLFGVEPYAGILGSHSPVQADDRCNRPLQ